jgi:hypothetical protein
MDQAAPACCIHCGYEVGIEAAMTYPECGSPIDDEHWEIARRRAVLLTGYRARMHRNGLVWTGAVIVYSIVLAIVTLSISAGLMGLAVMGGLLILSLLAGRLVALSVAAHQRRIVALAWHKGLWWMHGPWLMIGPATLIIFSLAGIERLVAPGSSVTDAALGLGLATWALASLACIMGAVMGLSSVLERHAVPPGARNGVWGGMGVLLVTFMLGVMLAAAIVGLIGGGVVGWSATMFANPEMWNSEW